MRTIFYLRTTSAGEGVVKSLVRGACGLLKDHRIVKDLFVKLGHTFRLYSAVYQTVHASDIGFT